MWLNPQETTDEEILKKFTEEILNGKLHFLCSCYNLHIDINTYDSSKGLTDCVT